MQFHFKYSWAYSEALRTLIVQERTVAYTSGPIYSNPTVQERTTELSLDSRHVKLYRQPMLEAQFDSSSHAN